MGLDQLQSATSYKLTGWFFFNEGVIFLNGILSFFSSVRVYIIFAFPAHPIFLLCPRAFVTQLYRQDVDETVIEKDPGGRCAAPRGFEPAKGPGKAQSAADGKCHAVWTRRTRGGAQEPQGHAQGPDQLYGPLLLGRRGGAATGGGRDDDAGVFQTALKNLAEGGRHK